MTAADLDSILIVVSTLPSDILERLEDHDLPLQAGSVVIPTEIPSSFEDIHIDPSQIYCTPIKSVANPGTTLSSRGFIARSRCLSLRDLLQRMYQATEFPSNTKMRMDRPVKVTSDDFSDVHPARDMHGRYELRLNKGFYDSHPCDFCEWCNNKNRVRPNNRRFLHKVPRWGALVPCRTDECMSWVCKVSQQSHEDRMKDWWGELPCNDTALFNRVRACTVPVREHLLALGLVPGNSKSPAALVEKRIQQLTQKVYIHD